ncbi:MAG: response regulator transcription factor [bacterium]
MPQATILIVDDEEYLADNLFDFLDLEGFNPVIRSSGETALAHVKTEPPDLILLDIQLPGIDGVEVLRQVKQMYPQLPVIVVSASSQKGTREKILQYGADAILMKPYDQDNLLQLIHNLLRRRGNHGQTQASGGS